MPGVRGTTRVRSVARDIAIVMDEQTRGPPLGLLDEDVA